MITLTDIKAAHQKISPYIIKTPQIFSNSLSIKVEFDAVTRVLTDEKHDCWKNTINYFNVH